MQVNGKTRVVGIIGDPIDHSRSPQMHNAAFNHLKLNMVYVPFHVKPESVGKAIKGMKALGIIGLNVTVPHKIEVMKYLDEISPDASAIGAVNTIYIKDNRLIGDNTDGHGFVKSLADDEGITVAGKDVVILGSGGSARAIGCFLVKKGGVKRLIFCNRTASRAKKIAKEMAILIQPQNMVVAGGGIPDEVWTTYLSQPDRVKRLDVGRGIDSRAEIIHADIIINTTSVGMRQDDPLLIDPAWIREGQIVCDVIYSPLQTLLLQEAAKRGARVINGLGMLIHQGALSFEMWTGCPAPVDVMRKAVENIMVQHK